MPDDVQHRPTRRSVIKYSLGAGTALSAGLTGYTWRIEPHWIQVVRRNLPVANLTNDLAGKTLVQISDLHVGPVVDEAYITAAMNRVSNLKADFLVITGDFMTCNSTEQVPSVVRVLSNLRLGKFATIAILGNHDYGQNCTSLPAADALATKVRSLGIQLLRNQSTQTMGLQFAGIDDYWSQNFNPIKAFASLDPKSPSIALCHNPDGVDHPELWTAYRGWILAGHTHGGQCKPPFLNPPLLPVNNRRYVSGHYDLFDGRQLYINRGLGYLHRVRFNARPEITVFTLKTV